MKFPHPRRRCHFFLHLPRKTPFLQRKLRLFKYSLRNSSSSLTISWVCLSTVLTNFNSSLISVFESILMISFSLTFSLLTLLFIIVVPAFRGNLWDELKGLMLLRKKFQILEKALEFSWLVRSKGEVKVVFALNVLVCTLNWLPLWSFKSGSSFSRITFSSEIFDLWFIRCSSILSFMEIFRKLLYFGGVS